MSHDPLLKIEGVAKLYGWYVEEKPAEGGMRMFKVLPGEKAKADGVFIVFLYPNWGGWTIEGRGVSVEPFIMQGALFFSAVLHLILKNRFNEKPINQ